MDNSNLTKKVSTNLMWRLLERFGAQGVTFIVSIVLARLLDPEVYGTIALITVITSILQVFVDSGLGTALIQKKNADDIDFSSVFYFNFLICIFIYFILYLFAPLIANFYNMPEIIPVIRALGLIIIISGFKNIQNAYVSRNLMFKNYFFSTLGGTIIAAFVGIYMAYSDYGVWALVGQNLANQFVGTLILWFTVKWRPQKVFSWNRLKKLFSYGWKLLISSLIDTIWINLRNLIVGKIYTTEDLAFYNKGEEYPKYATVALNSSIDSVLLPVMSAEQDDAGRVKAMTRRAITTSSFVLWPIMMGLAFCAEPLVLLLLTDKWLPAVPYLRIFCFVYAFYPIHTANLNAIKAMGRSDLYLKLEICKKCVNLAIILITLNFGVFYIALGSILGSIVNQIINSFPNRKLMHYAYKEQIIDILPYILLSLFMGVIVLMITNLNLPSWLTLLIQVPLGMVIYLGGACLLKFEAWNYCINIVNQYLHINLGVRKIINKRGNK